MNKLVNGPKFETRDDIPYLPRSLTKEDIGFLIQRGMIAKKDLVVGGVYYGNCRNASVARWQGNCFIHWRRKFSDVYEEEINHPEDDDGFDVFVPIKKLSDDKYKNKKR